MLLRLPLIAAVACCLALYSHHPGECYRRAVAAIDSQDAQTHRLERVEYELLCFQSKPGFEAQASLLKAELLIAAGHYTAALDALAIADTNPQTRVRALVLAGEALYRSGRFLEAGGVWQQVLKSDPQNIDVYRWLGVAYFELGTVKEAVHYLEKAAQLAPSDPRPHRVIGLIWRKLDEFATAAEAYRESLRRSSNHYQADETRFELAEVLNQLHEEREALTILEQCLSTADVLSLRAACLHGLGRTDEAATLLDRAIEGTPDHLQALLVRARIALERSEPQRADRLLERAATINPKSREVLHLQMAAFLRLGEREKAKAAEESLREVNSLIDDYHKLISKASSDPQDAEIRYQLGMLALRLGLQEDARWWLRASLYLEPKNEQTAEVLRSMSRPHAGDQAAR